MRLFLRVAGIKQITGNMLIIVTTTHAGTKANQHNVCLNTSVLSPGVITIDITMIKIINSPAISAIVLMLLQQHIKQ